MSFDVFDNYKDFNETYGHCCQELSNDNNCEQLGLIVCARKWTDSGMDEGGPTWPLKLGLDLYEHILIGDKLDIFIYAKNY